MISKMPQIGVILGETGDPESLPSMAAMNAVLLKSRSGYPPSAGMTPLSMALLRHLANQESTYAVNRLQLSCKRDVEAKLSFRLLGKATGFQQRN